MINLKELLKREFFKSASKIKGKFPAFSEKSDGKIKALSVKKIYEIKHRSNNFFLIVLKDDKKRIKERFYLSVALASQSSDLLVILAKDFALKNSLKLIQYVIRPKTSRINLLALKEISSETDFLEIIEILGKCKIKFKSKLERLDELI